MHKVYKVIITRDAPVCVYETSFTFRTAHARAHTHTHTHTHTHKSSRARVSRDSLLIRWVCVNGFFLTS